MTEKVQTKVYLPPDVKAMLDADPESNSEAVESALVTRYGGEKKTAIERKIEEKERRLSNLRSERNERNRAIEQLEQEREGLESQLEKIESVDDRRNEAIDDFIDEMIDLGATPPADHHRVAALGDKWFEGDTSEAATAIKERAADRDDIQRSILQ